MHRNQADLSAPAAPPSTQWVRAARVSLLTIVGDVRHFTASTFWIDSIRCQRRNNFVLLRRKEISTHQQEMWQLMCR